MLLLYLNQYRYNTLFTNIYFHYYLNFKILTLLNKAYFNIEYLTYFHVLQTANYIFRTVDWKCVCSLFFFSKMPLANKQKINYVLSFCIICIKPSLQSHIVRENIALRERTLMWNILRTFTFYLQTTIFNKRWLKLRSFFFCCYLNGGVLFVLISFATPPIAYNSWLWSGSWILSWK